MLVGEEPPSKKRKSVNAPKSRPKSKLQSVSFSKSSGCHHCKRTNDENFENELVKCDSCSTLYCERCLLEKYELVRQTFIKTSKNDDEEKEKEKETDSSGDEAEKEEDKSEKPEETKWKCPKCQNVCCCPPCRKKKGLKPVIRNLRKFKLHISGKFDSFYDYFVYERDHPKLGKEDITADKNLFNLDDDDDELDL